MTRNWSLILIDAGLRGLSQSECARELGCHPASVHDAAKRYGVALPNKGGNCGPRPKTRGRKQPAAFALRINNRFERMIAQAKPGETLQAFCLRMHTDPRATRKHAERIGHVFADRQRTPTQERCSRSATIRWLKAWAPADRKAHRA